MKRQHIAHVIKVLLAGISSKKQTLAIALMLFSGVAIAKSPLASQKQIGMFINSTTCVVLENGTDPYNAFVKDAVQKYWKSTPFEFIDATEFEKRRFDSKYSFLVLMKNVFGMDPGGVSYSYISLVLGDKSMDMTNMPELCSIPLLYSDDGSLNYSYAIPAIVKFVQLHAKNLEKKRFFISLSGLSYYNSSGFQDKELLLLSDNLAPDVNTPEKISNVYPNFVKLLSVAEMRKAIEANPKNALFLLHVGPSKNMGVGKCFEMIFDVEGNLYYYSSRRVTNDDPDGFTLMDFRHIR